MEGETQRELAKEKYTERFTQSQSSSGKKILQTMFIEWVATAQELKQKVGTTHTSSFSKHNRV